MLNKRQQERSESIRNAASGYTAVVLAIICFIILLSIVMALTRFFVGLSLAADTSTTAQTVPSVTTATSTQVATPLAR